MKQTVPLDSHDPWLVLGLGPEADDDQIRQAYLTGVKTYPPDRCAHEFQRIRWAYDELKDARRRSRRLILGPDPREPLADLLAESLPLKHLGPKPWLETMRQLRPKDRA